MATPLEAIAATDPELAVGSLSYREALDESYRRSALPLPPDDSLGLGAVATPVTGRFGILMPSMLGENLGEDSSVIDVTQQLAPNSQSHSSGRIVVNPPDLQQWRQRLFDVEETIVLTNDQFETYFPHVDNVYSHRSSQQFKRNGFTTHYWECRMKGRPPGTPKSDDPNVKKRKRTSRPRDLCDVKVKITEFFPGANLQPMAPHTKTKFRAPENTAPVSVPVTPLMRNVLASGQKLWTIQRVNKSGGREKRDAEAAVHRHTLAKSDEIKKNSIQRLVARQDTALKKAQKSTGARRSSGLANMTMRRHSREADIKLYAANYCPFSQRVWIALEAKGLSYQYCETDPSKTPTPTQLFEQDPRGQVPVIRNGGWACAESGIILEYLEDLDQSILLYPIDPSLKANCRIWIDYINTHLVPAFYSLLRVEDPVTQAESAAHLQSTIQKLAQAAHTPGPFFLGDTISLVDVHFAPFAVRLSRIMKALRGWPDPEPGSRLQRWLEAIEDNAHVKATMCTDGWYIETVEQLKKNRLVAEPGLRGTA